jgi:hypothetical protein
MTHDGCLPAWENADDGRDLFMTTFPVALDSCWEGFDPEAHLSRSGR